MEERIQNRLWIIPAFFLIAAVVEAPAAYADSISYSSSGVFSGATSITAFSGPGESWAFSFQTDTNSTVLEWAQTFFYGTADSGLKGVGYFLNTSTRGPNWLTGGSTGPEGSVFSLVVILVAALLIHLRFPTAIYPDRPE